ncbi:MAG: hypothetical protein WDO19_12645 [Bacteroidota bacterium]
MKKFVLTFIFYSLAYFVFAQKKSAPSISAEKQAILASVQNMKKNLQN